MKYAKIHSPIRKSAGYYDCLSDLLPKDSRHVDDTYVAKITKERNDSDMARQAIKSASDSTLGSKDDMEDLEWIFVDKLLSQEEIKTQGKSQGR